MDTDTPSLVNNYVRSKREVRTDRNTITKELNLCFNTKIVIFRADVIVRSWQVSDISDFTDRKPCELYNMFMNDKLCP